MRRVRQRLYWEGELPLPPDPNPGWSGHRFYELKGRGERLPIVCTKCGRRSHSREGLARIPCAGRPEQARLVHASHTLMMAGDFTFCNVCGGFGVTVVAKLKAACRGPQMSSSGRDRLSRLQNGRSPRDGSFVGEPVRLD